MKNGSKINGQIEFYRFMFTVIIVLFHTNQVLFPHYIKLLGGFHFSFFSKGFLAVEFFFILSGILMAKSISGEKKSSASLANQTVSFLSKKIKPLWCYHVPAFIFAVIIVIFIKHYSTFDSLNYIITSIPTFFFINKIGFKVSIPIGAEWYISVMLLSMVILYPILKRNFEMFSKIIAPLSFLFIFGFIFHYFKTLGDINVWTYFGYKCLFRGFAEICLGIFLYQVSNWLSNLNLNKNAKILLSVLEIFCLIFIIFGFSIRFASYIEFYVTIAIAVLVTIAYSQQSYFSQKFNSNIFKYLGFISLPIYLTHYSTIRIVEYLNLNISHKGEILLVLFFTTILTYLCIFFAKLYMKIDFKKLFLKQKKDDI